MIANMRSIWDALDRETARDVLLVAAANLVVAASFGAIAVAGGLPPSVPVLLSLVVFAGGAQFALVGIVVAGGGVWAAVAAALLVNLRLLPYGFAVADVLAGPLWRRLIGAHLVMDEAVAFVVRAPDPARRAAAFWASAVTLYVAFNLAVVAGALFGEALGDPAALGLDAAFPAVLLALVVPALREKWARRAAVAGATVAVAAAPFAPAGVPVLLSLAGLLVRGRR
jgi:predicted branched-subunit amino acid permease